MRDRGVKRVSLGVQSFIEVEVVAAGRPQTTAEVEAALGRLWAVGFPTLNLDLIYGLPRQDVASWLVSVQAALLPKSNPAFAGRAFGSHAAAWWGSHYKELLTEPKAREVITIRTRSGHAAVLESVPKALSGLFWAMSLEPEALAA